MEATEDRRRFEVRRLPIDAEYPSVYAETSSHYSIYELEHRCDDASAGPPGPPTIPPGRFEMGLGKRLGDRTLI